MKTKKPLEIVIIEILSESNEWTYEWTWYAILRDTTAEKAMRIYMTDLSMDNTQDITYNSDDNYWYGANGDIRACNYLI
jgi:hypothetical protein